MRFKTQILVAIAIFMVLLPVLSNAEVISLNDFLNKTLEHYRKVSMDREFVELKKKMDLSVYYPEISAKTEAKHNKNYNDYYSNHNKEYNTYNTQIEMREKTKFGTRINLRLQNNVNTSLDDKYTTSSDFSLKQPLFQNLLREFYYTKGVNLKYDSEKERIKKFEDYLKTAAIKAYIAYLEGKNDIKVVENSVKALNNAISTLKNKTDDNLYTKVAISDLEIDKNKQMDEIKKLKISLISKKKTLADYIGAKLQDVEFDDNTLDYNNLYNKYLDIINSKYEREINIDKLIIKMYELEIKKAKNRFNPEIYLTTGANCSKISDKFFKTFTNHFKTTHKSYSLGIGASITIYNRKNKLDILTRDISLKQAQENYKNDLVDRDNNITRIKYEKSIFDEEINILKTQIAFLENQLKLQTEIASNIIKSNDKEQSEIDFSVNKLIKIVNELADKKIDLYRIKFGYLKRYFGEYYYYGSKIMI